MVHKTLIKLLQPQRLMTFYWLSALISGGATLLGGLLTNKSNKQQANTANQLSQQQFQQQMAFNEQQAQIAREFASAEASTARAFNAEEAAAQRAWSARQAQINRNWQTEMSNTSHQREVKDLRAAGINPILSAHGGANVGASPSASGMAASALAAHAAMANAASGGSYHQATMQNALGDAAGTALQAQSIDAEVDKKRSEIKQIEEQIEKIGSEIRLTEEQTKKVTEEIYLIAEQVNSEKYKHGGYAADSYAKQLDNIKNEIVARYFKANKSAAIFKTVGLHNTVASEGVSAIVELVLQAISLIGE